jgi:uncharacterized protein with gpF-like domain
MKFTEWQAKQRIEQNYQSALNEFFRNFSRRFLYPDGSLRAFIALDKNKRYAELMKAIASRMTTSLYVESARTWREASSQATQGRQIYEMLKTEMDGPVGDRVREIINQNASLISSIPNDVALDVNRFIQSESMKGLRTNEIQSALPLRAQELTKSRIALIARTETSKSSTALTRARSEELDLDWYMWRTSKDARVRSSHQHMDRVLCSWSDAPNPEQLRREKRSYGSYNPGEIFNCRCYAQPIININRIEFPVQVHISGQITRMSRSRFEQMINPMRRAA